LCDTYSEDATALAAAVESSETTQHRVVPAVWVVVETVALGLVLPDLMVQVHGLEGTHEYSTK